jgi:hypothetical protein
MKGVECESGRALAPTVAACLQMLVASSGCTFFVACTLTSLAPPELKEVENSDSEPEYGEA